MGCSSTLQKQALHRIEYLTTFPATFSRWLPGFPSCPVKNVKLNTFHIVASSIAALGGLAVGTYNATIARDQSQQKPVQISVAVDAQRGAKNQAVAVQDAGLVRLASDRPETLPADASRSKQVAGAPNLLGNMRASLGLIAADYAEASKKSPAHKSSALIVGTTRQTALDVENLEQAIQSKDAMRVSRATKDLSKSMGKLQTTYALIPEKSARADAGMRTASANWSAYCTRYALANPSMQAPNTAEIRKLKSRVKQLTQRVVDLERETQNNAALHREVVRLRADISRYNRRDDSYKTYQSLLLTLAVVDGMFDAFHVTTRIYYPAYYGYFEPYYADRGFWEGYWAGYYDGYYANAGWGWYGESFIVPETLVIEPAPEVVVYQNITYQEIYQTTEQTVHVYEALPAEDLTAVEFAAPSEGIYSEPVAARETGEGPSEQQGRQSEPTGADPAEDADTDEGAPDSDPALELREGRTSPGDASTVDDDSSERPGSGTDEAPASAPESDDFLRWSPGVEPSAYDNDSGQPDPETDEGGRAPRDKGSEGLEVQQDMLSGQARADTAEQSAGEAAGEPTSDAEPRDGQEFSVGVEPATR